MSIHTTINVLTGFLGRMSGEATLGDLSDWNAKTGEWPTLFLSLKRFGDRDTLLSQAKVRIEKRRDMVRRKKENGHWSYDANEAIALRQLVEFIARFEALRVKEAA